MNNKPFGTGAIHTVDERDYAYVAAAGAPEVLPASYKTDASMFPVFNQMQTEACVSHAWARLLQIYWYKKTGQIVNFSPRFLHAYTSKGMGASDGRNPRVIGDVLVDIGCCTEALLPNDTSLDDATYSFAPITQAMLSEAARYKIPAYAFPKITQYELRHAIYHKGAVALLFRIGDEWWTPSWNPKDINPLRAPKVDVSGHEVTGEHWSAIEGFENSWGTLWNNKGYGDYNLTNYQPIQAMCIDDPAVDFNPPVVPQFKFNKDLYFGMTDSDVKELQIRLGMPEKWQTGYFGGWTLLYVTQYQISNNIFPTLGYCGVKTRMFLNSK